MAGGKIKCAAPRMTTGKNASHRGALDKLVSHSDFHVLKQPSTLYVPGSARNRPVIAPDSISGGRAGIGVQQELADQPI